MGREASSGSRWVAKRLLVAYHGVEDGEHLSHASGDRHFFLLAAFHKLLILCFQDRVIPNARQGGHIQGMTYLGSSTFGLAVATLSARA